ncbi:hypothetical protein CLOACE_11220 [Clostridium acetireducens DSM 10703]|uniref:Integral membrane protein n=1 Tax=Clostridium acetireducens DSM 10703 TaxID=1121290 RepID=A0A1E8EZ06_9CLOT|nr:TIGR01906 family membrane protein [Clostridium acetireducens]OFI06223.1 hypothetical protein CLOACE_11220 [Clostridium acetireducens DSM 10703]
MKKTNIFFKIAFIFISLLFSLLLSFNIVLKIKQLYYFEIYNLNINKLSNLSIESIKTNYDYIINYLSNNSYVNFKLPNLPSSKEGIIHFEEVKNIFTILTYLFYICTITLIFFYYSIIKNKDFYIIKLCSKFLLTLPLILITILVINFNKTFTLFHKITFGNNYWIFDPEKDPVINILPIEFFLHCSLIILLITILQGILLFIIYKSLNKKSNLK